MDEGKHSKAKLNAACRKSDMKGLRDMLKEKELELMKHERGARADGYLNNRQAYAKGSQLMIREIRKQIATIKTHIHKKEVYTI